MAINLTSCPTGLFCRLGNIAGIIEALNTFRGTTVPADIVGLSGDFSGADLAVIDGIWADLQSWQTVDSGFISQLANYAQQVVITMVNNSMLQADLTLNTALSFLIQYMIDNTESVQQAILSSAYTASASNFGNAAWIIGLQTGTGLALENSFNETLLSACTADSQTSGTPVGQEQFTIQGQQAESDFLNYDWPLGSGANLTVTAIDPTQDAVDGVQNWLTNSDFESWTAGLPDSWTVDVGTTAQIQRSSVPYTGIYALSYIGDSITPTSIYETISTPSPNAVYGFCFWVATTNTPAAGTLEIALTDSTGTILTNNQSNNLSQTVDLTSIGTTYVPVTGVFSTPTVLPGDVFRFRVRLSNPLSSGTTMLLDHLALAVLQPLYAQGPYVGVVSGNETLGLGDNFNLVINNNYADCWNAVFNQMFGTASLGFLLPVSNSPTVSCSLITP